MTASPLLERVLAAHGGLERWRALKRIRASASIGGGLWVEKGLVGALQHVELHIEPHQPRARFTGIAPADAQSLFTPERVETYDRTGALVAARDHPREHLLERGPRARWDALDLAYFSGYAMWSYLTAPFLFADEDFALVEREPWFENDERWDRLEVRFPARVPSHSALQTFYFGPDGLLRRQDYSVEVLGGTASAHYATEPQRFDGFVFPTRRRVYGRLPDNRAVRDRVAIAIDLHALELG